jgi:hypothetical protein
MRRQRHQLQRLEGCGGLSRRRASQLPTWESRERRGRGGRARPRPRWAVALCSIAVCAGVVQLGGGWWPEAGRGASGTEKAVNSTRHNTNTQLNTSTQHNTMFRPRCPAAEPVIECGDLLVPDVLCSAAQRSQMAMRFTTSHSSPWSNARGAHVPDSVLRVMQYAWSAPQFGSGNSWEATRVQVLAAALLSHADIICLQGLSHEQAQWMKDALDYKGYHGIISNAFDSRSSHRAQGVQREARAHGVLPDGPNAATFWRQKFTLVGSFVVGAGALSNLASGVRQGALVVVLNASTRVHGISTPYAVRVANTVVDPAAPPRLQVAARAHTHTPPPLHTHTHAYVCVGVWVRGCGCG